MQLPLQAVEAGPRVAIGLKVHGGGVTCLAIESGEDYKRKIIDYNFCKL